MSSSLIDQDARDDPRRPDQELIWQAGVAVKIEEEHHAALRACAFVCSAHTMKRSNSLSEVTVKTRSKM
jgi:hypothetical protein